MSTRDPRTRSQHVRPDPAASGSQGQGGGPPAAGAPQDPAGPPALSRDARPQGHCGHSGTARTRGGTRDGQPSPSGTTVPNDGRARWGAASPAAGGHRAAVACPAPPQVGSGLRARPGARGGHAGQPGRPQTLGPHGSRQGPLCPGRRRAQGAFATRLPDGGRLLSKRRGRKAVRPGTVLLQVTPRRRKHESVRPRPGRSNATVCDRGRSPERLRGGSVTHYT